MIGYSRMMGDDEAGTLAALKARRCDRLDRQHMTRLIASAAFPVQQ
jgi:hypothetical protein